MKLIFFVPESHKEKVKEALFEIGAGKIGNYDRCSFEVEGVGQFRPINEADPYVGEIEKLEKVREFKVEMVMNSNLKERARDILLKNHPYETPAYEFYAILE